MAGFLDKLFGGSKNSKDVAKDRLKLVLIHDRVPYHDGKFAQRFGAGNFQISGL